MEETHEGGMFIPSMTIRLRQTGRSSKVNSQMRDGKWGDVR